MKKLKSKRGRKTNGEREIIRLMEENERLREELCSTRLTAVGFQITAKGAVEDLEALREKNKAVAKQLLEIAQALL